MADPLHGNHILSLENSGNGAIIQVTAVPFCKVIVADRSMYSNRTANKVKMYFFQAVTKEACR